MEGDPTNPVISSKWLGASTCGTRCIPDPSLALDEEENCGWIQYPRCVDNQGDEQPFDNQIDCERPGAVTGGGVWSEGVCSTGCVNAA